MEAIIATHNNRVLLNLEKKKANYECNCQAGEDSCPLEGRCQTPSLLSPSNSVEQPQAELQPGLQEALHQPLFLHLAVEEEEHQL
jgi:hypothetical protein